MTIKQVAVIYDDSARPETTGSHCLNALRSLVAVRHVLPREAEKLDPSEYDLFIRIDDGIEHSLPRVLRPLAWWAIDTHLEFERCWRVAADADVTFAAQRLGAELLKARGIAGAEWLPLACDPDLHRPLPGRKRFDFCFVGNVHPGPRRKLIELLKREFPRHFVGNAYFDDLARTHSESFVAFNRSLSDDLNMRVFESLGCGSLAMTNELPLESGFRELFESDRHLATYGSVEELMDRMKFYLRNDKARSRIERAGRCEVVEHHTYLHRMKRVLERAACLPTSRSVTRGAAPRSPSLPDYFDWRRPELLALVPHDARDVLDVGCGAGRLGAAIRQRQGARVIGVEPNPGAAAAARTRLDAVVEREIEQLDPAFPPSSFDVVVCGDVLEHLRDPLAVLRSMRTCLRPEGALVLSVPNVRHHSVVRSLLDGNWTYESAGLLDHTHLRFYTRREIEKMLSRAGFESGPLQAVPGPGHEEWVAAGRPDVFRTGGLALGPLPPSELLEFFVYQWIGAVRPRRAGAYGLTSIIVVTFNQLAYTKQCFDSLFLLTDEPFELVVVDNGSTDGTPEFLTSLSARDGRVRSVLNPENRGFPAAANQGLALARGTQLLLLNNDTVLTTGWLRNMLDVMGADETWGLLGPTTNRISGDQQIEVSYRDLAGLDGFAWEVGKAHAGDVIETERLVGFCLLIRRSAFDRIGALDEAFGIGNFEDDDYCLRARMAGFRCGIVRSSFVHHFGSVTFRSSGVDYAALLRENESRFRRKWAAEASSDYSPCATGRPVPDPKSAPRWVAEMHREGGLVLRDRPRLSGCLIVRNNVETIHACLSSLKPWVDELIVVDTGSEDETPEIARTLGARVFHFPWCDDFSAARNESLRHARGEWIFWMDSDDTIDEANGRALRTLADGFHDDETFGYVWRVHCPGPDAVGDVVAVDHVKLFKNDPELRFEGRIHEQILPAIRRAGGDVAWTHLFVTHSGHDHTPEGQARKRERDLKLLTMELEERPGHPFTLFNFGMTRSDLQQHDEAIRLLHASLANSEAGDSHRRKAHALLVHSQLQMGRRDEAMRACERGLQECPDDLELQFRHGTLLHLAGRHHDAIHAYRRLLTHSSPRYFTSVDQDLKGYKAHQNLASIYLDLGDWENAEAEWRSVVRLAPRHTPGWRGLADTLLLQRKWAAAESLVESMDSAGLACEALLFRGRLAWIRRDHALARGLWEQAASLPGSGPEPLRGLSRLHFESGDDASAVRVLQDLASRDPQDPAVHHNLGALLLRGGDPLAAAESLNESLRICPESADTWAMLGHALLRAGNKEQAESAWHAALAADPANVEARDALEAANRPESGGVRLP